MSIKIISKISSRMEKLSRTKQLYIVPTMDGFKLLTLNFTLLVIGLMYANNFVLLFNFILFCLFLGSMFYTHFNLHGLELQSAKMTPLNANGHGILSLSFKSTSAMGHHFLSAKFKNNLMKIEKNLFSIDSKKPKSLEVHLQVTGLQRGHFSLSKLYLETLFPLHLFRCFVYSKPDMDIYIYPEKIELNLHKTISLLNEIKNEGDDFELNEFKRGDPIKRIHWKKLAQTNRWYSKKTKSPSQSPVILTIDESKLSKLDIEKQLSSICYNLYELQLQNIPFGISLNNLELSPESSMNHLHRCLRALANYEN